MMHSTIALTAAALLLPQLPRAPPPLRAPPPRAGLSLSDPRIVTVELDRVTGIDFGCDLTLRWPYVMALTPSGSAERTGLVRKGDQLVAVAGASVLGLPIGEVMTRLAAAEGATVELTLFRAEAAALQELLQASSDAPATVSVLVQQEGRDDIELTLPYGCNLRDELIARKINPYQSVTRWTNCNGKQLCGTCIVDVTRGVEGCTRRSLDEASTLRENPETYKLACITNVYGDIAVRIHPEVGAAQWTR